MKSSDKVLITNWFGIESHETDVFIHWSEKDLEKSKKLRPAYDLIAELGPEYKKALDMLICEATQHGRYEEHDSNQGC